MVSPTRMVTLLFWRSVFGSFPTRAELWNVWHHVEWELWNKPGSFHDSRRAAAIAVPALVRQANQAPAKHLRQAETGCAER